MNPKQIATCTKLHLEGKSIYDIAPQVDRSPSAVAQTLRRPDIKAFIEDEGQRIIHQGLSLAREVIIKRTQEGLSKSAQDATKDRSLRAAIHITNMAGLSGQAPSTVINALIYSQGAHVDATPESLAMLQRALGIEVLPDAIDIGQEDSPEDADAGG
ncbi:MAG: helix-turn-helix domain-containing protein [Candidatus Omnitrophota bacterium]